MSNPSRPAAEFEAKANREYLKLLKVHDELQRVWSAIKDSDLPGEIKLRIYATMKAESEMVDQAQHRISGMRKAVEISRGKQWVTSGDK